jgi:hypothetical protein
MLSTVGLFSSLVILIFIFVVYFSYMARPVPQTLFLLETFRKDWRTKAAWAVVW